jgi:hypothetical protein
VAVDEMHGKGTFFDERFDNREQFPIAAKAKLGHISTDPDSDRVTGKLAELQFYQLALPAIKPRPGIDFDPEAAERGDELFSGKANCNSCHREPLWTEPGWNQHTPAEMKIDGFEAHRAPASINAEGKAVHGYRTIILQAFSFASGDCLCFSVIKAVFITTGDSRRCAMSSTATMRALIWD